MGTVGLALVAAGSAGAEDTKPATKPKVRTAVPPTADQVLWEPIRDRTDAISFEATTTTTTPEPVRDDWYQSQTRLGQRPLVVRPR